MFRSPTQRCLEKLPLHALVDLHQGLGQQMDRVVDRLGGPRPAGTPRCRHAAPLSLQLGQPAQHNTGETVDVLWFWWVVGYSISVFVSLLVCQWLDDVSFFSFFSLSFSLSLSLALSLSLSLSLSLTLSVSIPPLFPAPENS